MTVINSLNAFQRVTSKLESFGISSDDMKDDAKSSFTSREIAIEVLGKSYSTDKGAEAAWKAMVAEYRDFQAQQERLVRSSAAKREANLAIVPVAPAADARAAEQAKSAAEAAVIMDRDVKPILHRVFVETAQMRDKENALWCDLVNPLVAYLSPAILAGQVGHNAEGLSGLKAKLYSVEDYQSRLERDKAKNAVEARNFLFTKKNRGFESAVTYAGMVALIMTHPNGIKFEFRKQSGGQTWIYALENALRPTAWQEADKVWVPNPNNLKVRVMGREILPLYKLIVLGETGSKDEGGSVPSDKKIALAIEKRLPDLARESPEHGFKPEDRAAIVKAMAGLPMSTQAMIYTDRADTLLSLVNRVFSYLAADGVPIVQPMESGLALLSETQTQLSKYASVLESMIAQRDAAAARAEEAKAKLATNAITAATIAAAAAMVAADKAAAIAAEAKPEGKRKVG